MAPLSAVPHKSAARNNLSGVRFIKNKNFIYHITTQVARQVTTGRQLSVLGQCDEPLSSDDCCA